MTDKATENMMNKMFAILMAICVGLASFSLKFSFDVNAEVKSMKSTSELQFDAIQRELEEISQDKEKDMEQDMQLKKFWKIHSATKEAINDDRARERANNPNIKLFKWPDLD